MRIKALVGAALISGAMALSGCGGGGGSNGGTQAATTTVIKGTVSKGPIRNGTVRIYALNADGSKGVLLKETATDNNAGYSADISPYTGAVLVEASGSYTDEATGLPMTISANAPLRAALPSISGTVTTAVTPLTELAVRQAPALTPANITAANKKVSDVFKFDVIATQPVAPTAAAFTGGTTTQTQIDYTLALATISQMANGAEVASVVNSLSSDLGSGSTFSATMQNTFQSALTSFVSGASNEIGATVGSTNLTSIGKKTVVVRLSSAGAPTGTITGIELTINFLGSCDGNGAGRRRKDETEDLSGSLWACDMGRGQLCVRVRAPGEQRTLPRVDRPRAPADPNLRAKLLGSWTALVRFVR